MNNWLTEDDRCTITPYTSPCGLLQKNSRLTPFAIPNDKRWEVVHDMNYLVLPSLGARRPAADAEFGGLPTLMGVTRHAFSPRQPCSAFSPPMSELQGAAVAYTQTYCIRRVE
jgi:hypothetical protein